MKLPRVSAWSVTLLLLLPSLGTAVPAADRSIVIEEFHATIDLDASGEVRVEERLRVRFEGRWNGIRREIPYGYTYPSGIRGMIRLGIDAVEDGEGQALEHWVERGKGVLALKIRVPDARDATRSVVLLYRAEDVVRLVEDSDASYGLHDELYWNVTGTCWPVPILRAVAEVRLPAGLASDDVRAIAYTGAGGARGEAYEIERPAPDRLVFTTTEPLEAYQGLTLVVGFEPGHVAHPTLARRVGWLVRANGFVGLPLALLAAGWLVWWRRGRDSIGERTIIPEWQPPMDLRPTEIGVLIDDRMHQRDLTACIVDLAVRGVITIHAQPRAASDQRDFRLELNEQALDGAKLETFEEALIDALFGGASEVTLGSLKHEFYGKLGRISRKVSDDLVVKGLLRGRPDKVRATWLVVTLVALALLVATGVALRLPAPYWVVTAVCAPLMLVCAWKMPQRTRLGLDVLARIRGMETFIATAERERLEQAPLAGIERLLPYAIALDLHERWVEILAPLFDSPPSWYVGGAEAWTPRAIGGVVGDVDSAVRSNLFAAPRSAADGGSWSGGSYSGGSGFSGGGVSGGGFGGGGGGGW